MNNASIPALEVSTSRQMLAWLASNSMKAVAEYFGVHYSTVSRAVAEYESEAQ